MFVRQSRSLCATIYVSIKIFFRIDGSQWAGAFAFNAFFSMFPLIVLFIIFASMFIDQGRAVKEVISFTETYVPISNEMQSYIFDIIDGMVKTRARAGTVALIFLIWGSFRSFTTLICAINHAWGTAVYNWWRLPLKSIVLLGITAGAVLIGMSVPALMKIANNLLFTPYEIRYWLNALGSFFIPLVVVFLSLSLFYRLAPRRPIRFAQVWVPALIATVLLQSTEMVFMLYLKKFILLNAVYGAFGGIMALLLWIYLSGCIFILGACLCAAYGKGHSALSGTIIAH
jgi:YihY family inner membrane protein